MHPRDLMDDMRRALAEKIAQKLFEEIEPKIGRAHVWTPVTDVSRMPSSAWKKKKKQPTQIQQTPANVVYIGHREYVTGSATKTSQAYVELW